MKSRLHRIASRDFEALREFVLALEGRQLLVYDGIGCAQDTRRSTDGAGLVVTA